MRNSALGIALVMALGIGSFEPARAGPASDAKLERCIYLHQRIEHYTRLRRGGGTAQRMESWRRSRARYQEEYRELRCHRFGRRLRLDR